MCHRAEHGHGLAGIDNVGRESGTSDAEEATCTSLPHRSMAGATRHSVEVERGEGRRRGGGMENVGGRTLPKEVVIVRSIEAQRHRCCCPLQSLQAMNTASPFQPIETPSFDVPVRLLLIGQSFLGAEPSAGLTILHHASLLVSGDQCPAEYRLWWLRLSLASSVAAAFHFMLPIPSASPDGEYLFSQPVVRPGKASLLGSLMTLQRTLSYLQEACLLHRPIVGLWLSCWSASQIWYANRCEELQPLLKLTQADFPDSAVEPQPAFPPIVFGNSSAVLANIAHHLTAVFLLQARPQLVTPSFETFSSPPRILRVQVARRRRVWSQTSLHRWLPRVLIASGLNSRSARTGLLL